MQNNNCNILSVAKKKKKYYEVSTYSCWVDCITPKSLMCLIYNLRSSVCLNSAKWTHAKHQSTAGGTFDSLRASPRALCLVSWRGRLSASHSSVTATAITNRITRYGNTKWLRTAVSGHPRLILIGVQRATVQQNFLIQALDLTPTVCRDVSTRSATGSQPLSPEPSAWWQSSVELSRVKDTLCLTLRHDMSAVLNTKWDEFWRNTLYEYY